MCLALSTPNPALAMFKYLFSPHTQGLVPFFSRRSSRVASLSPQVGWKVFTTLFAHSQTHFSPNGASRNATLNRVERTCAADFRAEGVCRISDRPYDVRLYKRKVRHEGHEGRGGGGL